MTEYNTDIEFLISAFAYSFASMNETFYLRKEDLKVIGVHIFDYSLVSECKSEYKSGLTKDEESDIKKAIIANEKNYDTHILIPRLSKEERFEIMSEFIELNDTYKAELDENFKVLIGSTKNYGIEFYKKGIQPGVEMENLTNGIDDEKIKSQWTEFYRNKTKIIAITWLNQQKSLLSYQLRDPKTNANNNKMTNRKIYKILTYCIAIVWIANGLFCKVLNLVPRHEQIVARILGDSFSRPITILIGLSEIIMAVWILSGYKSKLNAVLQIIVVSTMNTLEFILAPDLLLWGKLNSLFAFILILVIYFNEFYLNRKQLN
jgi:uncharacterized membrane protein YphA (DoxX/SURF4 family)